MPVARRNSKPRPATPRLARTAKRNFAGTRHELRQHVPVIVGTIMAVQDPERRAEFEQALSRKEQHGWTNLVAAIRRILAGERNADILCDSLDAEPSMIVETILQGLADPNTLADLLPQEEREALTGRNSSFRECLPTGNAARTLPPALSPLITHPHCSLLRTFHLANPPHTPRHSQPSLTSSLDFPIHKENANPARTRAHVLDVLPSSLPTPLLNCPA